MASISKSALRSRLAMSVSAAPGARGFQKNPQDFSEISATKPATSQEYLKKNWHFLSENMRAHAARLSTTFRGVAIDTKTGQFEMSLG